MTPAARVQTAIELLEPILAGAPAEKTLTGWARGARFAGSKDRAAVRDHVYDVLRKKKSCAKHGGGDTGRALMIGLLRMQSVDLDLIFTSKPYAPALLNDAERVAPVAVETIDLPDWILPELKAGLGADFDAVADEMRKRAPVVLRCNLRKTTPAQVHRVLLEDGIKVLAHNASETALEVIEGTRKVSRSRAYLSGLVELQDASSQAAIDLLPLEKTMKVLDFCAGGGGKLLAMAGRSAAEFFAHDAFFQRMKDLPVRASRAGVNCQLLRSGDIAKHAPFDLVFCDVPCSGSGTWRRDPDAKWRLTQTEFRELCQLQSQIFTEAAKHVRAGGFLAYATCSMCPSENRAQIEGFLKKHRTWAPVYQKSWTPLDGCDGFFTALLRNTL